MVVFSFCGFRPTATPTPTPLPTSMPVEQLFAIYQAMNDQNPTLVKNHKKAATSSVFEGQITYINDAAVQFHIEENLWWWPDKYVECRFPKESDVFDLRIGSIVKLLGDLEDVNGVVQFKNCRIVR